MRTRSYFLWLSTLVLLVAVQADKPSSPSIGGGGYDLVPFIYSWMIVFTGLWSLGTFVAAVSFTNRESSRSALALTAVGVITFTAVLLVYRDNLS